MSFKEQRMERDIAPLGNFFRALKLETLLDLKDEEWIYTEEPHVERRAVSKFVILLKYIISSAFN